MKLITELADALEGAMNYPAPATYLAQYWAEKLGCPQQSADLCLTLSAMLAKTETIKSLLEEANLTERTKSLYGSALSTCAQFVHPQMIHSLQCANVAQNRQQVELLYLAADTLPKGMAPDPADISLDQFISEVSEMLDDLGRVDMDPLLRRLLATQLSTLLMALHAYPTLGISGVTRIFGATAAEIARLDRTIPPEKGETKSIFQKVIKVAVKLGAALAWANAFSGNVDGLLTHGSEILGLDYAQTDSAEHQSDTQTAKDSETHEKGAKKAGPQGSTP